MKAYFVIPQFFYDSKVGKGQFLEFTRFQVQGIETLTSAYFAERSFTAVAALSSPLDDYQFSTCDQSMTSCSAAADLNSFNPFYNDVGLDFATAGDVKRGAVTGIVSGSDYGAGVLAIGIDSASIATDEGKLKGSFYIDFDEALDLEVRMKLYTEGANQEVCKEIMIRYKASSGQTEYRVVSSTYTTYGDNYLGRGLGWLNGSNGTAYKLKLNDSVNQDYGVRTRSYAIGIVIPPQLPVVPESECCYDNLVFADGTGLDYNNDYNSFYHKIVASTDSCTFKLLKTGGGTFSLIDDIYGTLYDTNENGVKAFTVEWAKVLAAEGEGTYQVTKEVEMSGIAFIVEYNYFHLATYSRAAAEGYVRLDSIMDSYLEEFDIDMSGMKLPSSLRARGMFGRKEPEFTQNNIIYQDKKKRPVSMIRSNSYDFQTRPVPSCITRELFTYHLMADELYVNDYNAKNQELYLKHPVVLSENKGSIFYPTSSKAQVNLKFADRSADMNKRVIR